MNKEAELKKINTEVKVYINEASFISNSCRNKIIKMLGKTYDIDLPVEDFARIDVELLENGNIIMRGDKYSCADDLSFDEVLSRYEEFKVQALEILERRGKKAFPNSEKNNIINLLIVFVLSAFFILVAIFGIRSFFDGRYIDCLWLLFIVFSWLFPSVRERFQQAFHYIKRKFKR